MNRNSLEIGLQLIQDLSSEQKQKHKKFINFLNSCYYRSSASVFKKVFAQAKSLARDLGKSVPKIVIEGPEIQLSPEGVSLISDVFTHLIRNSMDHGLEPPADRTSQGKPERGELKVTVNPKDSEIILSYQDDGKGLDLEKIKRLGIEKNMINADEKDPSHIADLIFSQGFSTAQSLTEISGRGVGMGAIQSFAQQNGASLEIVLRSIKANGHCQCQFDLLLPEKLCILASE